MPLLKPVALLLTVSFVSLINGSPLIGQSEVAVEQLLGKAKASYRQKDFQLSLERYSEAIRQGATESSVAFNAACCAALIGDRDRAFDLLDKAITMGWLDLRHLSSDSDLESLHDAPRWSATTSKLKSIIRLNKNRWSSKAFQTQFAENISDAEKAAGLSKLWAEVKFNFVNFHLVPDLDWDAEYLKCMPKALDSKSTLEYYRLLEQLVAQLRDGHTNVYLPKRLNTGFNARPQLRTRLIEDRVIIVKVLDSKLSKMGIKVGQEVLKIDGQPVKEYAEQKIRPYMAASTPQDLESRTYGKHLLRGPLKEKIALELRSPDGSKWSTEIARASSSRFTTYLSRPPAFSLKILEGNIAYVRLTNFSTDRAAEDFGKAFETIEQTDGLILDLRENGGGNSGVGWTILGYLTDTVFQTTKWHALQYRPPYRAWNRQPLSKFGSAAGTFNKIAAQHYKKPVAMLVGPRTFSAAEDMAAAFDMLKRGTIIGQPTGGSTGQPLSFALPGGGTARVCTKHDSYADGTEFVGKGIQPDIWVQPKVQDVIKGVDRTLEAARKELLK